MKKSSWVGILSALSIILLVGAIVFFAAAKAAEENREYVFWADFKDVGRASSYMICGREEPTAITVKSYTNSKELWEIVIINYNHKDIARSVAQFLGFEKGISLNLFIRLGNEWKRSGEATAEELSGFAKKHPISPAEALFIDMCLAPKQLI